ncbi:endonuclease/exonuclease/phosphatase family protein [Microlunatus panaciterrae]|uniref:Endonuclease/exonuclease/phosphatase (EEP) superfamily protein YafD n=1 Tax=Microlunatus panaciterrae TaxID=400768 RepID=A0ABS2RHX5_9ACTN|nr:endonuclease/exonuclease/phosphatase family protein [Microlunatus panaciterrae]MBM7797821.1 endonuclease/exonuclease/phosphatase (EEP) superfamily protein YafD [Microlunatus panaciterrae]
MPRRFQALWVSLGVLALPPGLLATFLRVSAPTDDIPAMAASFIPFGLLAFLAAFIFLGVALVRARTRLALGVLFAITACLLALQLSWIIPYYTPDDRQATTAPVTLMSLNLLAGQADPSQVMAQARRADLVVLLEYTPAEADALHGLGIDQRFPYSVGDPRPGDFAGSAIYSRYPLTDPQPLPEMSFPQWMVTTRLPGIGAVQVVAAHPCNPLCGSGRWNLEHRQLRRSVRPYLNRRLIIAGDFNAVNDHQPMRDLRSDGLRGADDLVGAGWLPTYPAKGRIPPIIGIDHVMLSPLLTATAIETFRVDGTDHLGLITRVAGTTRRER